MKRPEQELFESARHVPVELSQAQVAGIIKGLVLLPVPPPPTTSFNWLHFLTSKPIIMNSLIISLVVSSLVIFQQAEEVPAPLIEPQEEIVIIEQAAVDDPSISLVDTNTYSLERPIETKDTPSLSVSTLADLEDQLPESLPAEESRQDPVPLLAISNPLSRMSIKPSLVTVHSFAPVLAPVGSNTSKANTSTAKSDVFHSSYGMKIKPERLKKQLLNQLTRDGLIADKKTGVKMEIFHDRLIINGRELARAYESAYRKILNKHQIDSGPYRQIRISPTFIIVGDFKPDGFRGMMHGAVNTDTLEGFIPMESEGGLMAISGSLPGGLFPIVGQDPLVGIARSGSVSTIFPSMASGPYLMEDGVMSSSPLGTEPQIATSIFPSEGVHPIEGLVGTGPVIMDRWLSLKEEILIHLLRDNLIEAANSPVLMVHTTREISINGKRLEERLQITYRSILRKYEIASGSKTQIHITPDYIMAGEFDKNGQMINGHATGRVELDDKTERIIGLKMH